MLKEIDCFADVTSPPPHFPFFWIKWCLYTISEASGWFIYLYRCWGLGVFFYIYQRPWKRADRQTKCEQSKNSPAMYILSTRLGFNRSIVLFHNVETDRMFDRNKIAQWGEWQSVCVIKGSDRRAGISSSARVARGKRSFFNLQFHPSDSGKQFPFQTIIVRPASHNLTGVLHTDTHCNLPLHAQLLTSSPPGSPQLAWRVGILWGQTREMDKEVSHQNKQMAAIKRVE